MGRKYAVQKGEGTSEDLEVSSSITRDAEIKGHKSSLQNLGPAATLMAS